MSWIYYCLNTQNIYRKNSDTLKIQQHKFLGKIFLKPSNRFICRILQWINLTLEKKILRDFWNLNKTLCDGSFPLECNLFIAVWMAPRNYHQERRKEGLKILYCCGYNTVLWKWRNSASKKINLLILLYFGASFIKGYILLVGWQLI